MGLSDIAAGIEVTETREEREVTTVDGTDTSLAEKLAPYEEELPCTATTAATVLERYTQGASVGDAGRAGEVAPVTAAKTLHLLGESVSPVGPMGREIIRDWIDGELSRREARELARVGEETFRLAVYVETHDPLEEASLAAESVLASRQPATEQPLAETMTDTVDLL